MRAEGMVIETCLNSKFDSAEVLVTLPNKDVVNCLGRRYHNFVVIAPDRVSIDPQEAGQIAQAGCPDGAVASQLGGGNSVCPSDQRRTAACGPRAGDGNGALCFGTKPLLRSDPGPKCGLCTL